MKSQILILLFAICASSQLQAQAKARPDLFIESSVLFENNPNLNFVTFQISVRNKGSLAVNLEGVAYQCWLSKEASIVNATRVIAGGASFSPAFHGSGASLLAPGASKTLVNISFSYTDLNLPDYPFLIIKIDSGDEVEESDENNNFRLAAHGQPILPDLKPILNVNSVALDFRTEGTNLFFKVKNDGRADAPASRCKLVWTTTSGEEVLTLNIPALSVGEEIELQTPGSPSKPCPANCKFKVTIDPRNQILELKETNNSATGIILG